MIDDWEISLDKITWHVRPGIYWAPTEDQIARGVMEEPREFTAEDLAEDTIRFIENPWGTRFEGYLTADNVEVTDKDTVVLTLTEFSPFY